MKHLTKYKLFEVFTLDKKLKYNHSKRDYIYPDIMLDIKDIMLDIQDIQGYEVGFTEIISPDNKLNSIRLLITGIWSDMYKEWTIIDGINLPEPLLRVQDYLKLSNDRIKVYYELCKDGKRANLCFSDADFDNFINYCKTGKYPEIKAVEVTYETLNKI